MVKVNWSVWEKSGSGVAYYGEEVRRIHVHGLLEHLRTQRARGVIIGYVTVDGEDVRL